MMLTFTQHNNFTNRHKYDLKARKHGLREINKVLNQRIFGNNAHQSDNEKIAYQKSYQAFFFNYSIALTNVKSPIDQSQSDSLGKKLEETLDSYLTILAQNWQKIVYRKNIFFNFVFTTHC